LTFFAALKASSGALRLDMLGRKRPNKGLIM